MNVYVLFDGARGALGDQSKPLLPFSFVIFYETPQQDNLFALCFYDHHFKFNLLSFFNDL